MIGQAHVAYTIPQCSGTACVNRKEQGGNSEWAYLKWKHVVVVVVRWRWSRQQHVVLGRRTFKLVLNTDLEYAAYIQQATTGG